MVVSKVSQTFQVVVPKKVRELMKLKPGMRLKVRVLHEQVVFEHPTTAELESSERAKKKVKKLVAAIRIIRRNQGDR